MKLGFLTAALPDSTLEQAAQCALKFPPLVENTMVLSNFEITKKEC